MAWQEPSGKKIRFVFQAFWKSYQYSWVEMGLLLEHKPYMSTTQTTCASGSVKYCWKESRVIVASGLCPKDSLATDTKTCRNSKSFTLKAFHSLHLGTLALELGTFTGQHDVSGSLLQPDKWWQLRCIFASVKMKAASTCLQQVLAAGTNKRPLSVQATKGSKQWKMQQNAAECITCLLYQMTNN